MTTLGLDLSLSARPGNRYGPAPSREVVCMLFCISDSDSSLQSIRRLLQSDEVIHSQLISHTRANKPSLGTMTTGGLLNQLVGSGGGA